MKIIVIGAGTIGTNLSKTLAEENHEVFLVEANEETARRANEKLDVKVVTGSGSDPGILNLVSVDQADLVIAVATSDETNIVVCSLAASLGAKWCIARVRSTALNKILNDLGCKRFGIDEIINPELLAAQDIVRMIATPGAREVEDFAEGKLLLRAFGVPDSSPLCGLKMEELRNEDFPWPFLIIAVVRKELIMIPKGDSSIEAGDHIYVLLPAPSLGEFLTFVNPEIKAPKKIVIYGATITGEHVIRTLPDTIRDRVLLEEDGHKAEEMASRLENVRIINGSASEKDILTECGIEATDIFVGTSLSDHSNLVSAVLAKKMGAKTTIITTQQPDYLTIVDAMDINVIINPHFIAIDQILRLVRGKGVRSVTKLLEGDAEAIELVPEEDAPVTKAPLSQIAFPKNSIVGAVCSGSKVTLAKGNTHIHPGDKVIVFCQGNNVKKIQSLFTRKKFF